MSDVELEIFEQCYRDQAWATDVDKATAWEIWKVARDQGDDPVAVTDERAVPMPRDADEARAMALIGHKWLKDNAPDQLHDKSLKPGGAATARCWAEEPEK